MDQFFFYSSKILWGLLSPSNFIIFLVIFGTIALLFNARSFAKLLLVPAMILGMVIMFYPIGDFLIKPLENRFSKPMQLPEKVDGIIVLGGGEDLKRSLSWKTAELGLAADRYIAAAALAKTYPNAPVIFAGGSGSLQLQNTGQEATIAAQTLTAVGISEERLIIESSSRNTYENFVNIQGLLPIREGKYLLITSAFHMPRAVGVARKLDIDVITYPVDYRSNSSELRGFGIDLFDHLKSLEPAWKEWLGLSAYYVTEKSSSWFPSPKAPISAPQIEPVQTFLLGPPTLE